MGLGPSQVKGSCTRPGTAYKNLNTSCPRVWREAALAGVDHDVDVV
jgi:hypothetical protein